MSIVLSASLLFPPYSHPTLLDRCRVYSFMIWSEFLIATKNSFLYSAEFFQTESLCICICLGLYFGKEPHLLLMFWSPIWWLSIVTCWICLFMQYVEKGDQDICLYYMELYFAMLCYRFLYEQNSCIFIFKLILKTLSFNLYISIFTSLAVNIYLVN